MEGNGLTTLILWTKKASHKQNELIGSISPSMGGRKGRDLGHRLQPQDILHC